MDVSGGFCELGDLKLSGIAVRASAQLYKIPYRSRRALARRMCLVKPPDFPGVFFLTKIFL